MATAAGKTRCAICEKEKAILKCGGCGEDFCYNHFGNHRQQLSTRLEDIELNRDIFRQALSECIGEMEKHPLMQQIDQWERDSVEKIRQTAKETRDILHRHMSANVNRIEVMLNNLTDQLRQSREDNNFFETDLHRWMEQLSKFNEELEKPSGISFHQDTKALVTKLRIEIKTGECDDIVSMRRFSFMVESPSVFASGRSLRWMENGIVVAGGNGAGSGFNQLSSPMGMCIDNDDQTIYVADRSNHRIVEWKRGATYGIVVAGGNGSGNRTDQLNQPNDVILDKKTDSLIISDRQNRRIVRWHRQNNTDGQIMISNIDCSRLAFDRHGYLYVSDPQNHVVQRWKTGNGTPTVVAGSNEKGDRLNHLHTPTFIAVDNDQAVYVSDWGNHRIMKWLKNAKEGIVVAGRKDEKNSLAQLSGPQGILVDQLGTILIADFSNHRIVRWKKEDTQGAVLVGGNGAGESLNQLNYPQGLLLDRQGNLYVVDQSNNRVLKFPVRSNSN